MWLARVAFELYHLLALAAFLLPAMLYLAWVDVRIRREIRDPRAIGLPPARRRGRTTLRIAIALALFLAGGMVGDTLMEARPGVWQALQRAAR